MSPAGTSWSSHSGLKCCFCVLHSQDTKTVAGREAVRFPGGSQQGLVLRRSPDSLSSAPPGTLRSLSQNYSFNHAIVYPVNKQVLVPTWKTDHCFTNPEAPRFLEA